MGVSKGHARVGRDAANAMTPFAGAMLPDSGIILLRDLENGHKTIPLGTKPSFMMCTNKQQAAGHRKAQKITRPVLTPAALFFSKHQLRLLTALGFASRHVLL